MDRVSLALPPFGWRRKPQGVALLRRQCTRSNACKSREGVADLLAILVAESGGNCFGKAGPRSKRVFTHAPERPSPSALNSDNGSPLGGAVPPSRSRRSVKLPLTDFAGGQQDPLVHRLLSQQVLQKPFRAAAGGHRMQQVRRANCSPPSGNWSRPAVVSRTGCWPPRAFRAGAGFHQTFLFRLPQGDDA